MKDIFKKITVVFLAAMMAMMGASCKDKNGDSSSTGSEEPPIVEDVETDTDLIKNGVTSYSIVVPTQSDKTILNASKELQYFFEEATGITLSVGIDNGHLSTQGQYISIGETQLFNSAGITLDKVALGADGVRVITKDNTIFLVGGSDDGALFAVYTLLEDLFNYDWFYQDCYTRSARSDKRR